MNLKLLSCGLVSLLLQELVSAEAATSPSPELLLPVPGSAVPAALPASLSDVVSRSSAPVTVNVDYLNSLTGPGPYSITLTLFPGTTKTMILQKRVEHGAKDYSWIGNVEGEPYSEFIITVAGGYAAMFFNEPGRLKCHLRSQGAGTYTVYELDQSKSSKCGGGHPDPAALSSTATAQPQTPGGSAPPPGPPPPTTGGTVDVIVAGTSQAIANAGGNGAFYSVAVNAIAYANNVHSVSGTGTQLRLVVVLNFDGVPDNESTDLCGSMLPHLNSNAQAEQSRQYYGADLYALVGSQHNPPGGDGRYISGCTYENGKYSVNYLGDVNVDLAHETAHDMGAGHSPADGDGPGYYSYSYAFEWDTTFGPCLLENGTPMCTVTTGTLMSNTGTKIGQFSRPSGSYDVSSCCFASAGTTTQSPLGSATQDNSTTIANRAPFVAANSARAIFVDGSTGSLIGNGTAVSPVQFAFQGVALAESGGKIYFQAGSYHETVRFSTPGRVLSQGGTARVGP